MLEFENATYLGNTIFHGCIFSQISPFLAIFAKLNTREPLLYVPFAKFNSRKKFLQLKFAKINTRGKS